MLAISLDGDVVRANYMRKFKGSAEWSVQGRGEVCRLTD